MVRAGVSEPTRGVMQRPSGRVGPENAEPSSVDASSSLRLRAGFGAVPDARSKPVPRDTEGA